MLLFEGENPQHFQYFFVFDGQNFDDFSEGVLVVREVGHLIFFILPVGNVCKHFDGPFLHSLDAILTVKNELHEIG